MDKDSLDSWASIRSLEQIQKDERRDRGKSTGYWYMDKYSVKGRRAPRIGGTTAERNRYSKDGKAVVRYKSGTIKCLGCGNQETVDYMEQRCERCDHGDGIGYICPNCEEALVTTRFKLCERCSVL